MKKREDEGKLLTGDEISEDSRITDKYVFSVVYLDDETGEFITDKEYMYESDHNEIMSTLTDILEITDLRIGEEVLTANFLLNLKEKEWFIRNSKYDDESPHKSVHLRLIFHST